jgi:acetolactate synthase-1/2/3 large subunit
VNWNLKLPPAIVHVDIDAGEIDRNYPAAVGITGDARQVLGELIAQIDGRCAVQAGWEERVQTARAQGRAQQRHNIGPGHERILDAVRRALPRDGMVVKDATIPAYTWGNRLLEVYEPRTTIHSASLAIGPGLPLAAGAAVALPGRPVVLIAGDGGFLLNIAELSTAAQYRLPLRVLLFNDQGYGVLRTHQNMTFGGRHIAVDMDPIDFAKVAEGFGVASRKVPTEHDFAAAFDWALAQEGPSLLEVDLSGVTPMTVPYTGTSRPPQPRA